MTWLCLLFVQNPFERFTHICAQSNHCLQPKRQYNFVQQWVCAMQYVHMCNITQCNITHSCAIYYTLVQYGAMQYQNTVCPPQPKPGGVRGLKLLWSSCCCFTGSGMSFLFSIFIARLFNFSYITACMWLRPLQMESPRWIYVVYSSVYFYPPIYYLRQLPTLL